MQKLVSLFPLLKQYIQRRCFLVNWTVWAGSFKAGGNSNAGWGCLLANFRFWDQNLFIKNSARMNLIWNKLIQSMHLLSFVNDACIDSIWIHVKKQNTLIFNQFFQLIMDVDTIHVTIIFFDDGGTQRFQFFDFFFSLLYTGTG